VGTDTMIMVVAAAEKINGRMDPWILSILLSRFDIIFQREFDVLTELFFHCPELNLQVDDSDCRHDPVPWILDGFVLFFLLPDQFRPGKAEVFEALDVVHDLFLNRLMMLFRNG
jgi:hypothetical protein